MTVTHTREEILDVLGSVEVAAVATSAGESLRNRMMHFAHDDDFNIYLASRKGDPKTAQIERHPRVALLIHKNGGDINDSREVEISGRAVIVRDRGERRRALELTAKRSPVVKYLVETGNEEALDCIKVVPEGVKFRIFREIVQGLPPTVVEFPENRTTESDLELLHGKLKSWVMALRAPFFSASIVPVLLGTAVALSETGILRWGYFALALGAGVLLHAGANVVNDYFDHKSGNDEANREFVRPFSGGSRVIQLGLLNPREVLVGGLLFFAAGGLIGLYLAWVRGPLILALGAVGLLSGLFYSGRPFNWASRGIGEVLVGLNFGVLMTLGAYYAQTATFDWTPVLAAVPVALLITGVLWINEFPDYRADKETGKRTLVVRLGRERAVAVYGLALAGAHLALLAEVAAGVLPSAALLGLISLPLSWRAFGHARKHYASSFDLAPANALTIVSHLTTGLLLALVYVWAGIGRESPVFLVLVGALFVAYAVYVYRNVERHRNVFHGLKQVTS